eukprot:6715669-Pyramimonas_sp.AAC.1
MLTTTGCLAGSHYPRVRNNEAADPNSDAGAPSQRSGRHGKNRRRSADGRLTVPRIVLGFLGHSSASMPRLHSRHSEGNRYPSGNMDGLVASVHCARDAIVRPIVHGNHWVHATSDTVTSYGTRPLLGSLDSADYTVCTSHVALRAATGYGAIHGINGYDPLAAPRGAIGADYVPLVVQTGGGSLCARDRVPKSHGE